MTPKKYMSMAKSLTNTQHITGTSVHWSCDTFLIKLQLYVWLHENQDQSKHWIDVEDWTKMFLKTLQVLANKNVVVF